MKSKLASPEVDDLPALKVLLRARAEGRMPHAVLLTGADGEVLARAAERLAAIHLGVPDPLAHADCRVLRPAKKSRRINIESTQEVVAALRLTSVSARRVVLVHEPDRFMSEGANCFLKTLEEPPPGTLIVLQTANYYRVLPTILSRCLRFHVGGEAPAIKDPAWADWLREFDRLLAKLAGPTLPRSAELFIPAYALCARFEVLLELFTEEALKLAPSRRLATTTRKRSSWPTRNRSAAVSARVSSRRWRSASGWRAASIPIACRRSPPRSTYSRRRAPASN